MFAWLLLHTAAVLALVAVVLALCRWGRLGPAARHALWLVVLLKFLLPPVVCWPWVLPVPAGEAVHGWAGPDVAAPEAEAWPAPAEVPEFAGTAEFGPAEAPGRAEP